MRPSRRTFLRASAVGGALAVSGVSPALAPRAARADLRLPASVQRTFREALALGRGVRRGELTQLDWQERIGEVLLTSSVAELRAALDLDALARRARPVTRGCSIVPLALGPDLDPDEGAAMRVFFFETGRGDPPHVHFNSVTCHIVLAGRFRVRHYERIAEEGDAFLLRPTRDREISEGQSTSISELRENGHWHHCLEHGVLLDVEQGRLDPTIPPRNRVLVDLSVPPRADGTILAPALTRSAALRAYG